MSVRDYSYRPWPPVRVACMLPCECIAGGSPPSRRCNGRWTRCPVRLKAIREWQDQQPEDAEHHRRHWSLRGCPDNNCPDCRPSRGARAHASTPSPEPGETP
jgi:hypothetical protein